MILKLSEGLTKKEYVIESVLGCDELSATLLKLGFIKGTKIKIEKFNFSN